MGIIFPGSNNSDGKTLYGTDAPRSVRLREFRKIAQPPSFIYAHIGSFPAYELISLQLLPLLHDESERSKPWEAAASISTRNPEPQSEPEFHALLTSHHLKSPHKRRSLQQWSSELCLHGFAKVGHPGLIYCSGLESDVRDFVSKVKDMQWLALRVRFAEVLPNTTLSQRQRRGSWMEVEKVGEVVDEMRKLGRESYVLNLGIGSGGAK